MALWKPIHRTGASLLTAREWKHLTQKEMSRNRPGYFVLVLSVAIFLHTSAQIDSARFVPLVGVHFSGQLPGGDLVNRYGSNLNAGGNFQIKTKRNWLFGIEGNYFFGDNV